MLPINNLIRSANANVCNVFLLAMVRRLSEFDKRLVKTAEIWKIKKKIIFFSKFGKLKDILFFYKFYN